MAFAALVGSDLDGTLFDADHQLAPTTVEAIDRAFERGVPVVAVTGRSHRTAAPRLAHTRIEVVIGSNGATTFDLRRAELLDAVTIDHPTLVDVVDTLRRELPGVCFGWERVDGFGWDDEFRVRRSVTEEIAAPGWHPGGMRPADLRGAVKLMALHVELEHDALLDQVLDLVPDGVTASTSGAAFVEITGAGVDKGAALARHTDAEGIDASDVITFGDQRNDLTMIRWAGTGVAMANAHPAVIAAADLVIGHHTDHAVAAHLDTLHGNDRDPPPPPP